MRPVVTLASSGGAKHRRSAAQPDSAQSSPEDDLAPLLLIDEDPCRQLRRYKYVVGRLPDNSEQMLVFPSSLIHADIAYAMRGRYVVIVGAGFIHDTHDRRENWNSDDETFCHGESVSLGIRSRGDADTELLMRGLRGRNTIEPDEALSSRFFLRN